MFVFLLEYNLSLKEFHQLYINTIVKFLLLEVQNQKFYIINFQVDKRYLNNTDSFYYQQSNLKYFYRLDHNPFN